MNLPPAKPTPPPPLLPPPPPPPPASNDSVVKGECSNCGCKDQRFFHHVLLRGVDRLVCTSCVLRLHPSSFCPTCFEFFEHPLSTTSSASAHRFTSCVKCSSLTHIHCLPSPPPPPSSFLCPPCSKPNFSFFPVPESAVDKNLAVVLLCASKIASASMTKHLTIARVKADRTVRESAAARKRAKEALEHCLTLHKFKRVEGSLEVSGSRNLTLGTGNIHKGICKKESLNGFTGGQGKVKVASEGFPLPQQQHNGLSVNKIGANGNPIIVKDKPVSDGRLGNREQNCHDRTVGVTSTT